MGYFIRKSKISFSIPHFLKYDGVWYKTTFGCQCVYVLTWCSHLILFGRTWNFIRIFIKKGSLKYYIIMMEYTINYI